MPDKKMVVPSILEPDVVGAESRIRTLPSGCRLVEIRADHFSPQDVRRVVACCHRETVVTARRERDGGGFGGTEQERLELLLAGLHAGAAYVDIEIDSSLAREKQVDPNRLVLSWHGGNKDAAGLHQVLSRMTTAGAALYKLVPDASRLEDLDSIREFLSGIGRDGPAVTCFASGRIGALSRILGLSWGSRWTIGFPDGAQETAPGQWPVSDLLEVYDVATIGTGTRFFGLLGSDIHGSPSPAMHNAALRALGIDARYLPLETDRFQDLDLLADPAGPIGARGFGITMPFKTEGYALCDEVDRAGRTAGAVNTILPVGSGWHGHNTDALAVRRMVESVLAPGRRSVLINGAGGTARTVATLFLADGHEVALIGRNRSRVEDLSRELGIRPAPDWTVAATADILVNATPEGGGGEIWPDDRPLPGELVLDAPYGRRETDLVRKARESGLAVLSGRDWILAQAVDQFRLLTGRPAPDQVMSEALERWFGRDPA